MNVPNQLTILRVIMVPIFVVAIMATVLPGNNYIAAGIFILACITDFFDGYLARKYNLVTNFGKFLDPLADKLLVCAALVSFLVVEGNPMPAWVVIVIISREFIISGFRLVAVDNNVVIAASYWAKVKTFTQMIMCIVLILNFDTPLINGIEWFLIYASVAFTVISLVDYIVKNRSVLQNKPAGE